MMPDRSIAWLALGLASLAVVLVFYHYHLHDGKVVVGSMWHEPYQREQPQVFDYGSSYRPLYPTYGTSY